MHAVAAIRAEPPAAAGGDVYAAVGAFLTRHALGAHPANYAFAFAVVSAPEGMLACQVARIEEGGFRLTADDIQRLGGEPARGAPVSVPLAASPAETRVDALLDRTAHQVEDFSRAVRDIHAEIHRRRQMPMYEDEGDPIPGMADGIADNTTLLCLDELEVRDIADAMVVGRLFQKLFDRGVVVVTTSNRHPDDLYKHGLQRDRFVPFIGIIKEKLDVLALEAAQDYRLGRLAGQAVYYTPLGLAADTALDAAWARLTDDAPLKPDYVQMPGRRIAVPAAAHQVARFTFSDLCEQPLGPSDYLAIAAQFSTVILKDIPQMNEDKKDSARRFVTLIDALYEHRTALVCSAAALPDQLYVGREGSFEFNRTASRLIEMQAADYIKQRHVEA